MNNGTGTSLDCFCHAACDPGGVLFVTMVWCCMYDVCLYVFSHLYVHLSCTWKGFF